MEKNNTEKYDNNEYLINISLLLYKSYNKYNNEKEKALNKFKEYLFLIFQSDYKIKNLFNTLGYLLFKSKNNNIYTQKNILILYPIIFDFNPKLSYKYIDNFLLILKKFLTSTENDKAFLSYIFNEFTEIYLKRIQNSKDKQQFYIKLLNYSINLIEFKMNNISNYNIIEEEKNIEKNEHLLGFIFLSILIDKFNIFSNKEILNYFWNIFCYFLTKKNFKYIYHALYCILKLINNSKEQFKIYCNLCLFTILDYLIDDNATIRKISLDIIFSLTKYCRNEILTVKDNIIEFLNILKNDNDSKVKETCLQTLNFIGENNIIYSSIFNKNSERNNEHLVNISKLKSETEKNYSNENIANAGYDNSKENINRKKNHFDNKNYSYDVNKNFEFNKYENTFQPINKVRNKIKINLSKKCPDDKINYFKYIKNKSNGNNNLSISKLSYSVIQSNNVSIDNTILDKSDSISKNNNNKKTKINISKKYASALKEKNCIKLKKNFGIDEYKRFKK